VRYTEFVRENISRPASAYEVRYDDREGLLALGIAVDRHPTASYDARLRETARPFAPGPFAEPPPPR